MHNVPTYVYNKNEYVPKYVIPIILSKVMI